MTEILSAEKLILETLNYSLLLTTPLNFLEILLPENSKNISQKTWCSCLLKKALFFKDVFQYSPRILAQCSLIIHLK